MTGFPENVLDELETSVKGYLTEYEVVRRGTKPSDPAQTIGLRAGGWLPLDDSHEMPSDEPTLSRHNFEVELLVKAVDEADGRRLYADGARRLRSVLYRDAQLRLRLEALSVEELGSIDRFKRLKVVNQTFLSNAVKGNWFFVATTRFYIEVETSPAPS